MRRWSLAVGALVGLTSGEGGALRVRHVAVLVGGQCSGGEAAASWLRPYLHQLSASLHAPRLRL